MRTIIIACCGILLCGATARAQRADTTARADTAQRADTLSYDDAAEVAYLYNLPAALRATRDLTIPASQTIEGDLSVLEASLTVAGHVTGRVVVINGDVALAPGARIDGELVVTGGEVRGADSASVGGALKLYRPVMMYRMEGDRVVAVQDDSRSVANWFRRWKRRHERSMSRITLKSGTYNRVEGMPVLFGPTIRSNNPLGPLRVEALGIYRSADGFEWKADNLGYTTNTEMQFGYGRGVAVGVDAFDIVQAAEPWQLRDSEIGLASFFLHRDYRDYYNRKGWRGYVSLREGSSLSLTVGYGKERWQPRMARDPFTLFRNSAVWRANPVMDAGRFELLDATIRYDTRNNIDNPWTGWLVVANVEHGWSPDVVLGPAAPLARPAAPDAPSPNSVSYTRGFLDARRYNRISPQSQLNLRLVLGGWLAGDPLPLQRRFSLGGAGTLPGYDFRDVTSGEDVLTCSDGASLPGSPAQCERVALLQAEYRGNLRFHLFGGAGAGGWNWSFYHPLQWVVFADAGRGWLLHERAGDGTIQSAPAFPSLGTFKSDIGIGLDAEVLGVFIAKSLTDAGGPINFSVRLKHRF
ncbi:MAG TPA: BamA/TamA family outer membrane protein [Gemmatimonadaceae bacterium]|nr:BamA/TamA family outer membrane protein [Gemmatimonadaceae bacterium]